jgi:RNA polymerase sigma-70 factor (ECF subfamily)
MLASSERRETFAGELMTDLVRRAREGDKSAFEQLYRLNVGRVYALCLRMAGDPVRAEELTQDVFVRAWEKMETFRGEAAFASWLHRITVNIVYQRQRSESRRLARRERVAASSPSASRHDATTVIDLERAIRRLPAGARSAFVLHDLEGYRHEEIAAMTGLAVGTLKSQLHRARRLLREALER